MNWDAVGAIAALLALALTIVVEWPRLAARLQAIGPESVLTLTTGIVFLTALLPMAMSPILGFMYPKVAIFHVEDGPFRFWLYAANIVLANMTPVVVLHREVLEVAFRKRLISFYLVVNALMIIGLLAYAYKPF